MDKEDDPLTHEIIAAAIAVSKYWGNGVLENVYKKSLAYDTIEFDVAFRADIIVNQAVILEAKAMTATLPVHRAQLLTYMRLSVIPTGLLMNFHAYPFTKDITRLSL